MGGFIKKVYQINKNNKNKNPFVLATYLQYYTYHNLEWDPNIAYPLES